jgi:hypothetical protein
MREGEGLFGVDRNWNLCREERSFTRDIVAGG